MMSDVKSKTICMDFEEQLAVAAELYGYNIQFMWSKADVYEIIGSATQYSSEVRTRVEKILIEQMRRYQYLFS